MEPPDRRNGPSLIVCHALHPRRVSPVTPAPWRKLFPFSNRARTPKSPPFLLIHGDADPVVPLQQSQRMLDALNRAGVPAELIVKKGGGHPWLTMHEEVKVMSDWFNRQLEAK